MKKVSLIVLFLAVVSAAFAQSGELKIEGVYQGKNLYVQNPFATSGVGFCVYEVRVNNQVTTDEVNSSAFEIDLLSFQLTIGSPIVVQIKHKEGCKPKVLNPEVVKPSASYTITSIASDADGKLTWKTTGESGALPFIVEQYRWNKWVKVGEVQGKGTAGEHAYTFKVTPHSGKNKVRIKQVDNTGAKTSQDVPFTAKVPQVNFALDAAGKTITFTSPTAQPTETMYEIFDKFGNVVARGYSEKVDVSKLAMGTYYLNYDKTMATIIIPKRK
jgi:hypothetical protein